MCHYFRVVILAIVLFLLYATSAWVMLRSVTKPRLSPIAWAVSLAALIAHTDAIVRMVRSDGPFSLSLLQSVSLLGWTLAALACIIAIDRQNRVLGAILLGFAALAATLTLARPSGAPVTDSSWELTAHILLSLGAAALLFAAAVTAILLFLLDKRLRLRRIAKLPRLLPALDALEEVMFRLIGAGFTLLTLALLTGFIFVTDLFAQHLFHKTLLSLVAWVLFGTLLIGRIAYGWRGRAAVRWTLSGFGILALAYFGSKFVLEVILGKHWG